VDFILGGVSKMIRAMSAVLDGFSFTRDLSADIRVLSEYYQKANVLVPVNEALKVGALFITVQLCLIAYYWITRAINLLRGAG
jgi:hypothetical protein